MSLRTGLWTEVTTSSYAHERAALDFVRQRLPDREPFRAWANFTFIAEDGARNEVDLLVVSPTGVYLVEIKSHPGRMEGDAGTWVWITPQGKRRTLDNPLLLTERKAKKLKSLLLDQSAFRASGMRRGFYLKAVVFLANPELSVALNDSGKTDVYGPDPAEGRRQRNTLPGIVELLVRVDPRRGAQADRLLSRAIAQAVDQAGIRESTAHRRVGMYELGAVLAEGEGWQDFVAEHPHAKGTQRRIRLYLAGRAHSEEERQALGRAAQREFRFLQGIDHPGIERPLELLANPRGPALVFPYDPVAQRLDHWLAGTARPSTYSTASNSSATSPRPSGTHTVRACTTERSRRSTSRSARTRASLGCALATGRLPPASSPVRRPARAGPATSPTSSTHSRMSTSRPRPCGCLGSRTVRRTSGRSGRWRSSSSPVARRRSTWTRSTPSCASRAA